MAFRGRSAGLKKVVACHIWRFGNVHELFEKKFQFVQERSAQAI
jgi:hypothetical protein